jgi:hypothetical protein
MILRCTKRSGDFIPMVKIPYFWQPKATLKFGDELDIEDLLGHQLLATYAGCFEVVSFGDTAKRAEPKRGRPKLDVETKMVEKMETKSEVESFDVVCN